MNSLERSNDSATLSTGLTEDKKPLAVLAAPPQVRSGDDNLVGTARDILELVLEGDESPGQCPFVC